MLPSFQIPCTDLDGRPKALVACDLPVWAFFWGSDPVKVSDEWLASLLTRAVIKPVLTPELVARLGEDFAEPGMAYLLAVGYLEPDEVTKFAGAGWKIGRALDVGALHSVELLEVHPKAESRVGVPLDAIRGPEHIDTAKLIAGVAERTRIPPHVIWQTWTASEFYLTLRILQTAQAPPYGAT